MVDPIADSVSWQTALLRGTLLRCPRCGEGKLLKGYLTPEERCSHCDLDISQLKAEDGPAFFTMSIVCFFVIPLVYWGEVVYEPPILVSIGLACLFVLASLLILMPPVKGCFLAAAWKSKADSKQ